MVSRVLPSAGLHLATKASPFRVDLWRGAHGLCPTPCSFTGRLPAIFLETFPGARPWRAIVMRPMSGVIAPRVKSMAGANVASGHTTASCRRLFRQLISFALPS